MTPVQRGIISLVTCALLALRVVEGSASENLSVEACRNEANVCVRARNSTGIDFDRFMVQFVDHSEAFGKLRSGETSAYRRAGRTYGYAYTDAFSGQRWFVLQPIDFLGARLLAPGMYTFDYHIDDLGEPVRVKDRLLHGYMRINLETDESGD